MEANQELSRQMKQAASTHVALYAKHFEIALDYSESSLRHLDDAIGKFHADGAISQNTYIPYLAYVGEVACRNINGQWFESGDRGPVVEVRSGEKSAQIFPFAWVHKRFEEGPDDSIAFKYQALKSILEIESSLSDEPRKEASDDESDTASSSSIELQKCPAIVFMMVAAADGSIDEKEVNTLKKIIQDIPHHESKLFQASLAMLVSDFEGIIKSCSVPVLQNLSTLIDIITEVRESIPEEADAFCRALYDLGEKVAKASGGFFGFGKKIGKEEEATLSLLSGILGTRK